MVTQEYVNDIAYRIVGCAIEVHRFLGPGLLESIYESCLIDELVHKGLNVKSQLLLPVHYKGRELNQQFKLDLLVEDLVIVELKSVETILPVFKSQLLTYMKLADKPKGLLINFNCSNITNHGLVPLVNENFSALPKNVLSEN